MSLMDALWCLMSLSAPVLSSNFAAAITTGTDEDVIAGFEELISATRDNRILEPLLIFLQDGVSSFRPQIGQILECEDSAVTIDA